MPRPRPAAEPVAPAGGRAWLAIILLGLLAMGAATAWLLWPREDKLGEVSQIQKQVLDAGGKLGRGTIDQLIRTVDRMSFAEISTAYRAAGAEWKRIREEAIDAYFQAVAADRPRLLDEHLGRMQAYHDLLIAMNPGSRPDSPAYLPRDRRRAPPREPVTPPPDPEAEEARRQLAARFDDAVEAHAKSRGRPLPVFR